MTNSPHSKRQKVEQFEDSDFQLQPVDAETREAYLKRKGHQKLPLPQQDRDLIQSRQEKMRHSKLSLMEAMVGVTVVCILLGVSNFVRFDVYTVGLGLTALTVLLGAFDFALTQRHRNFLIVILLIAYAAASTWIVAKVEGWFL